MKRKVSIATTRLQSLYGDYKALELAAQAGADAVDFHVNQYDYRDSSCPYSGSDAEITAYFTALYQKAQSLGLTICQTHGRYRIYQGDAKEDAAALENARRDLLATKALHAPYCVMHSVTTTVTGPDFPPQRMRDVCYETFRRILEYAKEYGVILATETFGDSPKYGCCDFFGDLTEFEAIYRRLCAEGNNRDYFKICVDTGHSNKATRFGNPPPEQVLRQLGKDVVCLHLNDNDTLTDQHKLPMTGTIDWDGVFDALDAIGYRGVYNMELHLDHFGEGFELETAAFAVKLMRFLLQQRYGEE